MKYETTICKHCENLFQARVKELNRGNAKFCSRSCAGKHNNIKLPNVNCAQCNVKFYRRPSKIGKSKSGLNFCSRKCKEKAQEYVDFLNKKHRREVEMKMGKCMMYDADMIITIHRPKEKFLDKVKRIMTNLVPRKYKQ